MKRYVLPPAAPLLTALLLFVPARAGDKTDPDPAVPPAPEWVKMIDQGDLDPRLKGYKTPEGVKVEVVAEDPVVVHPAAMAFAEDGTPFVLERRPWAVDDLFSDKTVTFTYRDGTKRHWVTMPKSVPDVVKTLTDSRSKGVYDQSTVVFEDELPSNVFLYDRWLYVAGQGTVRRYKQSKADGPYDVKEVVAQGFCGRDQVSAYGMIIGPDGWLYITASDGANVVEGSDGSRATVLRSGAVFRCRPDGSKMQTYAIGFAYPCSPTSFDPAGDLFHADAGDGDKGSKFNGRRLMQVVEGADFGWRGLAGIRNLCDPVRAATAGELPGKLAPMLAESRGTAGGLLVYNDTRFPENYRGLIFVPDPALQTIHAYKVERKGATVQVAEAFDFLKSDDRQFKPCQAILGPDGAIYLVDHRSYGGADRHGRIYRLTWAGTKDQPVLPPRGMDSWAKINKLEHDDLVKTLSAEDASDREHAARELARRGEKERPALLKLFMDADAPDPARMAALGALESMWNADVQAAAAFALEHDSNPDVRRLSADALGLNAAKGDDDVHVVLLRALNDAAPEVRRSAALAMSHVAADGAPDNLINTWAFDDGRDPYLRDGLVRAIENLGKPGVERLIALGESGSQKNLDKAVQAFTMMRTRPAADALPQMLGNPHLSAAQRAALVRSYENYLLDPPVSLAPMVQYLIDHPTEDQAVKLAGAEVLAAGEAAADDKAAGWAFGLLDEEDAKLRLAGVKALATLEVGPEDARRVGHAYLEKKLPREAKPQVEKMLERHAEKDAECARLLKQLAGRE